MLSIYLIIKVIDIFSQLLYILILIRCFLSWLPVNRNHKLIILIYQLTDPILDPIHRILEKTPLGGPRMMIDFSPVFAIILIQLAATLITNVLLMIFG